MKTNETETKATESDNDAAFAAAVYALPTHSNDLERHLVKDELDALDQDDAYEDEAFLELHH